MADSRSFEPTVATMTDDRLGGIALIAGSVGTIVTMALHPTGHDLFEPGQLEPVSQLNMGAHALGILSMPMLFLGALAVARRVAEPHRLGISGLVVYGFALAAGMAAATVSGFIAPDLAREMVAADVEPDESWGLLFHYNGMLNQAFASVLVIASSVAILLWSAAIVKTGALARGIGVYGLFLSPVIILALLSGHLRLDVHGFGMVVLGQSIWFIVTGALLLQRRE